MPKVSVIIPIYNTEKYLRDCLNSLINQSLDDIEIVMVDDGSKDSSPEIIKEYADKYPSKIKYITQVNSGQGVARNKAVQICTGDYIGFLDSDDSVKPEMFEKMYKRALETDADMVVCDYEYITDTKRVYKKVKPFPNKQEMFIDCFVDPWNKLFKRTVLIDNGVTFPEGYFYEDTGWFIKCIPFVNECEKIDEALAEHFKREGSSMTALDDKRVQHIFPVLQSVIDFYKEKGVYDLYVNELEYFCSRILLCSSFRRISRVKDRTIRKDLVERTFSFLNDSFPSYKQNKYYEQNKKLRMYVHFLSKSTSSIILAAYKTLNAYTEWSDNK